MILINFKYITDFSLFFFSYFIMIRDDYNDVSDLGKVLRLWFIITVVEKNQC